MPPHHHHGGGFRGGFGPYGYGWGYPVEYPATELVVVNPSPQDSEFQRRAMAHIMTLPKGKRYAAYLQIFGKAAAPGSLGSTMNDSGRGADDRTLGAIAIPTRGDRTGIFSRPTLDLPRAGAPEILGDCGCAETDLSAVVPGGSRVIEPPIPHQTLHGSAKRLTRYYVTCRCGYKRGRNARFPCSCGVPPSSWSPAQVREYRRWQRRHRQFLAKRGYCICVCGTIRYAFAPCPCGAPARS